jgi:transcriptional regulator with XRE-family HTH domain
MFTAKIRQIREEQQIPQRKLAAALDMDTATYSKLERGLLRAKREQVIEIAKLLKISEKELLTLWLAEQLVDVVADEKEIAKDALNVAKENI